jgi:hypothetical protein
MRFANAIILVAAAMLCSKIASAADFDSRAAVG